MTNSNYGRKDRLIKERRHDTYKPQKKLPENSLCEDCGALFSKGHWTWNDPPEKTHPTTCPACRRIADQYPAGIVQMRGNFYNQHRDEIWNLIRNVEKMEKQSHPMERIMNSSDESDTTILHTTGVHLARRIGEVIAHSFQGEFSFQYSDGEQNIRVMWQRD